MLLPVLIYQKDMIAGSVPGADVHILSKLYVALCPEDKGSAVSPGGESVGRKPVHAEMLGCPIIAHKHRIPEILELRIIRMVIIPNLAVGNLCVLHTAVKKELLDLMASDITQDAAVFLLLKKPLRPALGIPDPVRPEAVNMNGSADSALLDELSRKDSRLHMDALAVINHIFSSGLLHHLPGRLQLLQGSERRLVREIILSRRHCPKAQSTPLAGHGSPAYQLHLRIA